MIKCRTIEIESTAQLAELRRANWREAGLYQITPQNKPRLAWFQYPNGARRINIQVRPKPTN